MNDCQCSFYDGCAGLGFTACRGCGGDHCICECGGVLPCEGCPDCDDHDDDEEGEA